MPVELRDVSKPENTTFKSERYFQETLKLKSREIYVSRVTGWYVNRNQQLGRAERIEDAVEGKKFEGVIRFAIPCIGETGEYEGIVMLSLDHRHLMEFTQHVLPTDERFVVYPSYASGNYAFMFDDEGWIICHPKFYNIRGILPDGTEFDPAAPSYAQTTSRGGGSIQPGLRRLHQSKLSLHCERSPRRSIRGHKHFQRGWDPASCGLCTHFLLPNSSQQTRNVRRYHNRR